MKSTASTKKTTDSIKLIGAPRAGKSHFVKDVLKNLKKMRPMQSYLKVMYCCANFKRLSSKDHRFADEIIQVVDVIKLDGPAGSWIFVNHTQSQNLQNY